MSIASTKLASLLRDAAAKLDQMDLGSALALYQQAVQFAPDNAGALMGLAMAQLRSGQASQALAHFDKLWKAASTAKGKHANTFKASVLAQIGLARQTLGQLKEALQAFEQAHRWMPSTELAQRIAVIKPLLSSPEPVQQLVLGARQMVAADQVDSALKMFNAALQLHADSVEALHGLAMLQRLRGLFDLALPLLQKAVILAPERADLYNDIGMLFQDRGDLPKAISFHKRALKLEPNCVFALANLGVAYKRQGKNDDAIAAYRAALALAPQFAEVHNNLGNLLRIEGQLAIAREHLERAIALKPDYADARANLAAVEQADIATKPKAVIKVTAKSSAVNTVSRASALPAQPGSASTKVVSVTKRKPTGTPIVEKMQDFDNKAAVSMPLTFKEAKAAVKSVALLNQETQTTALTKKIPVLKKTPATSEDSATSSKKPI